MSTLHKQQILGKTIWKGNQISFVPDGNYWREYQDGKLKFDAGFTNITCAQNYIDNKDKYEEDLSMLGYFSDGNGYKYNSDSMQSNITIKDKFFNMISYLKDKITNTVKKDKYRTTNFQDLIDYIILLEEENDEGIFASVGLEPGKTPIIASISSRDLTKSMVRVKSSNIWSYNINIKDIKDKTGTVYVQFKNKKGGPGDIYCYYDVPINVWRKWLSSPSAGHYFWKYIRNRMKYSKLTGDKKGKLKNAIN